VFRSIAAKAKTVFLNPNPVYTYENIICGCQVRDPVSGVGRTMSAVGNNTWRGFHRCVDSICGSKEIFNSYFKANKIKILSTLNSIKTVNEMDMFEDTVCLDIKDALRGNIIASQLTSYNKIRKPVDLFIEHIAAMCSELSERRVFLTGLLFLPLDSQIFASPHIFSRSQLNSFGIRSNATFKDVQSRKVYGELQSTLSRKAADISDSIGMEFHRIYFDLLWNDRFKSTGNNLFETNF
jgi:hypothetical protein